MKARVFNPVNFGLRPRAALIFQRVWPARVYVNAFLLFSVAMFSFFFSLRHRRHLTRTTLPRAGRSR